MSGVAAAPLAISPVSGNASPLRERRLAGCWRRLQSRDSVADDPELFSDRHFVGQLLSDRIVLCCDRQQNSCEKCRSLDTGPHRTASSSRRQQVAVSSASHPNLRPLSGKSCEVVHRLAKFSRRAKEVRVDWQSASTILQPPVHALRLNQIPFSAHRGNRKGAVRSPGNLVRRAAVPRCTSRRHRDCGPRSSNRCRRSPEQLQAAGKRAIAAASRV
jgi:hypothetical protein